MFGFFSLQILTFFREQMKLLLEIWSKKQSNQLGVQFCLEQSVKNSFLFTFKKYNMAL